MPPNRNIIKQIFKEHWEDYLFQNKHLIPDYVKTTVQKMLSCRDKDKLGYHKYVCPEHPNQIKIVPNSCKSSFCNPCGKWLTDKFVAKVEANFPETEFHHICFTVPDLLRGLLSRYPFLLNCLFQAASQTVLSWCKERHFLPLVIAALHTYGRNLKEHQHIHLLTTSGGLVLKDGQPTKQWKDNLYFPFVMLRKRYQSILINLLKKTIRQYLLKNPNCGELTVFSYPGTLDNFFDSFLKFNWYVHDSESLPPDRFTISYIVRYTKRPPIAESRILYCGKLLEYSPDEVWVTFVYKQRNLPETKLTLPVKDFIGRLIQHILPPHFRQVRYYGVLSNRRRGELLPLVFKLLRKHKETKKFLTWRERTKKLTGKDPLACPICQKEMKLEVVAYFSKRRNCLHYYFPP